MHDLTNKVKNCIRYYIAKRHDGQGMAEYGLILAGVALTAIVAVDMLGTRIALLLNRVVASLS